MSRRKSTKRAPAAVVGAPLPVDRTIPLYRVGRWQGGFAVWRSDGTLLGWHLERTAAETHLRDVVQNSS